MSNKELCWGIPYPYTPTALKADSEATKLREEIELLELRVKKLKLMQEKRMIEEQLNMAEGLSDN